jgi:hypothetical protein
LPGTSRVQSAFANDLDRPDQQIIPAGLGDSRFCRERGGGGATEHFINLFIWPSSPGDDAAPKTATRQGFHILEWTSSGMTFCAVSDLNEGELQEFALLIQG